MSPSRQHQSVRRPTQSAAALDRHSRYRSRPGTVWVLCSLLLMYQGPVRAGGTGPAQWPLVDRSPDPPQPNVVFTIDDSGSMNLHFMPEGNFKIRPTDPDSMTVRFPDPTVDINYYMTDGFPGDPSKSGGWTPACSVPALIDGGETLFQKQFRSPDVNSIYYNPDVRYEPWPRTSSARFADAAPTAAAWEPTQLPSYNLALNPAVYRSGDYNWCHAPYSASRSHGQICSGPVLTPTCTISFYPGLVYRLKSSASDPTRSDAYVRYNVNGGTDPHAPPVKHPSRTDCAATQCSVAEEQRNLANWFTYYRSRMQLTQAAVSDALVSAGSDLRVGLASINTGVVASKPAQAIDGVTRPVMRLGVRELSQEHRDRLLSDLRSMTSDGSTPLKGAVLEVGRYFMRSDSGNPWQSAPGVATAQGEQLACRRAYNILTTDGYNNVDPSFAPGNYDSLPSAPKDLPATDPRFRPAGAPYGYTPARPYLDNHANTLADYASYYFVNDLRPDIPNHVEPQPGTAQSPYWQHLTQFAVGMGVVGSLDSRTTLDTDGQTFRSKTLAALTRTGADALNWPDPDGPVPAKIDDLWHAAVNTGGDYYAVRNAPELKAALMTALDRITGMDRAAAGVSVSGNTVVPGRLKFVPSYQSGIWSGDLQAYALGSSGAFESLPTWRASERVPPWASRNIVTWAGTAGAPFNTELDGASKSLISADPAWQDLLINYVRGDESNEGSAATQFRNRRSRRLADFVNSPPTLVKAGLDMGYRDDLEPLPYSAYLAQKKARRDGVVFIGGNGGLLHGFSESTGAEVFAYLPRAVMGNLSRLSRQDYGSDRNAHQFFVDGPLAEADAYLPTPRTGSVPAWTNLLVGSQGAGAKGVFVLDVTDLTGLGANAVLAEASAAGDDDLGHVFSAPEVGRLGGRWFAFFGNGAYSAGGKAVLFALDLASGLELRFPVETSQGANGLMGVRVLRSAVTGEVEALYGGDLRGNLWRVDFARSATPGNWRIGFRGKPMFTARDGTGALQPITAKPTLAVHYLGGRVVLFGTGQLMDSSDPDAIAMQSLYGVRDMTADGDSSSAIDLAPWTSGANHRDKLQQQVIDTTPVTGRDGADLLKGAYYRTSANAVDWDAQRGWYMDLVLPGGVAGAATAAGQRVLQPVRLIGEFAWVSTLVPGGAPQSCETSKATGYDFLLPAITGAMHDQPVFDTNGDGRIDDQDSLASGAPGSAEGQDGLLAYGSGGFDEAPAAGSTSPSHQVVSARGSQDIRIYCLHLGCNYQIKDRVWKQLVEPPRPD